MNTNQFELFKAQLKTLTPQQLESIRGEIAIESQFSNGDILSDEELKALSSLFN